MQPHLYLGNKEEAERGKERGEEMGERGWVKEEEEEMRRVWREEEEGGGEWVDNTSAS